MRFFIFIKSFIVIFAFNGAWANTQALPLDQRPEAMALAQSGIGVGASHKMAQKELSAWLIANNFVDYRSKEALLREALNQRNFKIARLLISLENKREVKVKLLDIYLSENNLDPKEGKEALLFKAAEIGDIETARFLLDLGVDVNARNAIGQTPLHRVGKSAENKDFSYMALFLIERGANVQLADSSGYSPLHHAARDGNFNIAKLLMTYGAEVNAATHQGQTALHITIEEIGSYGKSEEKIKNLIKTALVLTNNGARLDAQDKLGQTPRDLIGKVSHNRREFVLQYMWGRQDRVERLTTFHYAVINGRFDVVESLIADRAVEVNAANDTGQTALHLTIRALNNSEVLFYQKSEEEIENLIKTAAVLMDHGADLDAQDKLGETPRALIDKIRNNQRRSLLQHISGFGRSALFLRWQIVAKRYLSSEDMNKMCQMAVRGI